MKVYQKIHIWVSNVFEDALCILECRSVIKPYLVKRLTNMVEDGTVCGEETLQICLAGVCQEVGCDLELGSEMKLDNAAPVVAFVSSTDNFCVSIKVDKPAPITLREDLRTEDIAHDP